MPPLAAIYHEKGVELRGCPRTCELLGEAVHAASEEDWSTEYLDYILSVKVVDSLSEAMTHINRYGSAHTDTIVTEDRQRAVRFLQGVEACSALVNASTRFADGYRYGLGAEVHVR